MSSVSMGVTLVSYDFTTDRAAVSSADGVTAADVFSGAGITPVVTGGEYAGNATAAGWTTNSTESDALANEDYIQFNLTVDSSYSYDLEVLEFALVYNTITRGNNEYTVQALIGGDYTTIASGVSSASGELINVDLSGVVNLQGVTDGETERFRIYSYGMWDSTSDTYSGFDNISVTGVASPTTVVPEPSSLVLLGLGGLGLMTRRKR